jgi:hypothetical protein
MRRCKCKETLLIRIDKKEKHQKKGARNKNRSETKLYPREDSVERQMIRRWGSWESLYIYTCPVDLTNQQPREKANVFSPKRLRKKKSKRKDARANGLCVQVLLR